MIQYKIPEIPLGYFYSYSNIFCCIHYHYHHRQTFSMHCWMKIKAFLILSNLYCYILLGLEFIWEGLDRLVGSFSDTAYLISISNLLKFSFLNVLQVFFVHNEEWFYFFLSLGIVFGLILFITNWVIIGLFYSYMTYTVYTKCILYDIYGIYKVHIIWHI